MPVPFPTKHTAAAARMKADRQPFEPTGEPVSVDQKSASPVPLAQIEEFAPVTTMKSDLVYHTEPVEAKLPDRAQVSEPNPPIPQH